MKILYCLNPLDRKKVEDNYIKEKEAAQRLNISFELFDYDEFLSKNEINVIEPNNTDEVCIYRGWMMKPSSYKMFYNILKENKLILINTPEQYKFCHWLPESYEVIKEYTAKSLWFSNEDNFNIDEIFERLTIFNGKPLILKDYVKSMKHFWNDACFISDSKNKDEVNRVVSNFLKYLYEEPQGGLVFREFLELEPIGVHSKSKMPLTEEYRLLFLNNKLLSVFNYWDEGNYTKNALDLNKFNEIAKKINSNLFTMDIAKKKDGNWVIVELGDGQVAGFPENADLAEVYKGFIEQDDGAKEL